MKEGERIDGRGEVRKSKYYLFGYVKVLILDSNGVDFRKQRPLLFQGDKLRWREENTLLKKRMRAILPSFISSLLLIHLLPD